MEKIMFNAEKKTPPTPETTMGVMDAIYKRRAVRSYLPQPIGKMAIQALLDAAVHAPTAIHEEAWAFAVIQDKEILYRLSESAKKFVAGEIKAHPANHALAHFTQADFNVFYDAGTLIVIYGKPIGPFVTADCWLAAENLMLAAYSMGFGSCVIGSAVSALNTPEWKATLNIPAEMTAIAPIIVGVPNGEVQSTTRKPAEILIWK
jgi:nitroreductase